MYIAVLNAISHFLVDWTCVCALFGCGAEGEALSLAVILYNTLAFSTQCVIGALLDSRVRKLRGKTSGQELADGAAGVRLCGLAEAAGMIMVLVGAALKWGLISRVVLFGLGNSLFHVGGGMVTYEKSRGKAAPLGVFVAPGAFGVTLGTLFPGMLKLAQLLLALVASACIAFYAGYGKTIQKQNYVINAENTDKTADESPMPLLPVVLLTAAVAVRAVGGSAAEFTWKQGAAASLLLTLFVFLGKGLGGFAADRFGAGRMSGVSIPLAALLTAFLAFSMPASLAGQFLLNLSMPVTLFLLHRMLPKDPGLAFGLAASALWPGTIAGMLIKLTGAAAKLLIIACFLLSLGAIIYSERYRRKK